MVTRPHRKGRGKLTLIISHVGLFCQVVVTPDRNLVSAFAGAMAVALKVTL